MFKKLRNKLLPKAAFVICVFVLAVTLLGLGVLIGLETDNLGSINSSYANRPAISAVDSTTRTEAVLLPDKAAKAAELVLFIASIVTILLAWTAYLIVKAAHGKKSVEDAHRLLQLEIERQRNTSNELHVTHQQLSSTAGQLGGILEGVSELVAAVDTELRFISFNRAYRENIKSLFDTDIYLGMNVEDLLEARPRERDHAVRAWNRALAGEKFAAGQEFVSKDGERYYFEITYTPILDEEKNVIGAAQICRDVTKRKLTEQMLKQEMAFVSAAIDVNSSLVIVLDLEGRIVRFNQACESLSGYTFEELEGRIFWNILIPSEDIAKIKSSYRNFDSTFFSEDYVNRWITKDEQIKLVSWKVSAIKNDNGDINFIVGTGIDITEKREIETARNRMMMILENSPDFISIYDFQGRVTYLNPAGRKLAGLNEDADISRIRMSSFYPTWTNELMQAEAIPTAVKKGSWLGNAALKRSDDEEFPISQLVLSHQNDNGKVEYFSTVIRDISSQKRLEERLEAARDQAVNTIRAKSEFVANMSHEIRTPMNGIIGISELLLDTELDAEQRDFVETIQSCGDSLLTIINDILDFSKLEAGKLEFDKIRFDLDHTVDSVVEMFTQSVYGKGLELSVLIASEVPTRLVGDAVRLRQVLTNLVSNAVRFTEKGEIVIRVALEESAETPLIRFSVSDTGLGISPESREELFLPYAQAKDHETAHLGGTGLGLAISKQIVEMMGGEIGLESDPGQGSTFWFTARFGLYSENDDADNRKLLTGKRILIVDDNDTNRRILVHQVKSWGLVPDEARSGEAALPMLKTAALNGEHFDLAVVDLKMPVMDGFQLVQEIKEDKALRKTKIVLMPSAADRARVLEAKDWDADLIVSKPLRLTSFRNSLAALFEKNATQKTVEAASDSEILTEYERIALELEQELGREVIDRKPRILVAEDSLVNQKVISNQVRKLGYSVKIVQNGEEVLRALGRQDYDLILMDCEMPVMDGYEATKRIRSLEGEGGTRVPIIAVTAHALKGDKEKCLRAGMDAYISKPTRQLQLTETIKRWLGELISEEDLLEIEQDEEQKPAKTRQRSYTQIKARLDELCEACGPETVRECISLFIIDTADTLEHLSQAIRHNDLERAAVEAHKLKGSAANMGAVGIQSICHELLGLARSGNLEDTKLMYSCVSEEYEIVLPIYYEMRDLMATKENPVLEHM